MNEVTRTSKELCEHDWVGDDFCAYCDADATRDMLTDARLELEALRAALGVGYEPHQSLHERMLDAANHKRVERTAPDRCGSCDGSRELVKNDSGGDPAYDYSIPCPECSAHEPESAPHSADHLTRFTEWLVKEMPEGTVIGDPAWWARKLLAAACVFADEMPTPPPGVSENPNEGPIGGHGFVEVADGVLPAFHNHWSCSQCGRRAEYVKAHGCPESCGRIATSTKEGGQ